MSVLFRQSLDRRIGSELEVAAWTTDRNQRQISADWQFTTDDARIKLKRLYPKIIV